MEYWWGNGNILYHIHLTFLIRISIFRKKSSLQTYIKDIIIIQGGKPVLTGHFLVMQLPNHTQYSNYFFMECDPKGYRLKGIFIVFITYLTKKLWFFYKIKWKIHVPNSTYRPKIKLLWWRTLFNKSYANILQTMSPNFFHPLDPQKLNCWGVEFWGQAGGPSTSNTTAPNLCLMGHVRWVDKSY